MIVIVPSGGIGVMDDKSLIEHLEADLVGRNIFLRGNNYQITVFFTDSNSREGKFNIYSRNSALATDVELKGMTILQKEEIFQEINKKFRELNIQCKVSEENIYAEERALNKADDIL